MTTYERFTYAIEAFFAGEDAARDAGRMEPHNTKTEVAELERLLALATKERDQYRLISEANLESLKRFGEEIARLRARIAELEAAARHD